MSYQVLARKWRPKTFTEMVGQEHVLQALINALDQKRLHHAYLFTGTRGVGKTTIARILAKCLNCEVGIGSKPCERCDACVAIDRGRFIDLIEVDAASRTKVEDTRELLENIQYAPASGRYKVYLIDEVHMLSGHSFNALLKTLEEPPEHVKFLLATTDPQKLPVTVLSRCLQFHLKNLSPELISTYLATVLTAEKITFEKNALDHLAQAADGSMRDGLSLLDQAIAYCKENITSADVHAMLGTLGDNNVLALLTELANHNAKNLLAIAHTLAEQGTDFYQALEALLSQLHALAVLHAIKATPSSHPEKLHLLELANRLPREDIQLFYQIALIGRRDLPLAPSPKVGFEMVLLRMLDFRLHPPIHQPTLASERQTKPAALTPVHTPAASWTEIIAKLTLSGMTLALANNCELSEIRDEAVHLILSDQHGPLLNPIQQDRLEAALKKYFNRDMRLTITLSHSTPSKTPAKIQEAEKNKQKAQAIAAIESDPGVAHLLESFQATIDNASIHPVNQED